MNNMLKQITARLETALPIQPVQAEFLYVVALNGGTRKMKVGIDCAKLTQKFATAGVSAHVIPEAPGKLVGSMFLIIGDARARVVKALDIYDQGQASMHAVLIRKIPKP